MRCFDKRTGHSSNIETPNYFSSVMDQVFVKSPSKKIMLKSCCCCVDLRVGCIVFAVLGVFVNCGFFGTKYQNCGLDHCNDAFKVLASGSTFGLISSLCLIFGVLKSNHEAVFLSLIAELIRMILYFAFAIMSFVVFAECNTVGTPRDIKCDLQLVGGLMGMFAIFAWIYPWLCALSLVQKMTGAES